MLLVTFYVIKTWIGRESNYCMNDIKIGMAFLFVGFAYWACGCGASFDDSAEELGLVCDNPADGGRPSPSFQNDIHPILTQRCALAGCHVADGPHDVDLRSFETIQESGEHEAIVHSRVGEREPHC